MDIIVRSIKHIRTQLSLQPRQSLIGYLESRLKELEQNNAPDYALYYGRKAIQDLRIAESEEILIGRLAEWVSEADSEKDADKRSVIAQVGAFMMCASYDKL
jgi:hypothetical protein